MPSLPKTEKGSRVGILGGSFDPPHLGHQFLALAALATTPIDALWVVPCSSHAFQKPLTSFEHRYRMCELAFSRIHDVHVLTLENELPTPSYTVNTIESILGLQKELSLSLVMGSDLMKHFDTWEGADRMRTLCRLSVFDRETLLPGVQSSQIREAIKMGDFNHLDARVIDYIQKNSLYRS